MSDYRPSLEEYWERLRRSRQLFEEYNANFPTELGLGFGAVGIILALLRPKLSFYMFVVNAIIKLNDRVDFPIPLISVWILLLFVGYKLNPPVPAIKGSPPEAMTMASIDKKMWIFFIYCLFTLLLNAPGDLSMQGRLIATSIMYYYFCTRFIRTAQDMRVVTVLIALSAVGLGYEALVAVQDSPKVSPFYSNGGIGERLQGLGYYANANEFGFLMVMALPFVFITFMMKSSLLKRVVAVGSVYVIVIVMFKSGSRTVMVTSGLMIFLLMVFNSGGNIVKKLMVAGVAGVLLLGALSFVPGPVKERLDTIRNFSEDESFMGRVRAWGYSFDMFGYSLGLGVGAGQWSEHHGLAAHNTYLQIMAETGVIGFWCYLSFFFFCFKSFGYVSHVREKSDRLIALSVLSSFAGYSLYIFLGNHAYGTETFLYLGLAAAVTNFRPKHLEKEDPRKKKKSRHKQALSEPLPPPASTEERQSKS
jgi:O-antigen ligase